MYLFEEQNCAPKGVGAEQVGQFTNNHTLRCTVIHKQTKQTTYVVTLCVKMCRAMESVTTSAEQQNGTGITPQELITMPDAHAPA